jgi:hypothetical protein
MSSRRWSGLTGNGSAIRHLSVGSGSIAALRDNLRIFPDGKLLSLCHRLLSAKSGHSESRSWSILLYLYANTVERCTPFSATDFLEYDHGMVYRRRPVHVDNSGTIFPIEFWPSKFEEASIVIVCGPVGALYKSYRIPASSCN